MLDIDFFMQKFRTNIFGEIGETLLMIFQHCEKGQKVPRKLNFST